MRLTERRETLAANAIQPCGSLGPDQRIARRVLVETLTIRHGRRSQTVRPKRREPRSGCSRKASSDIARSPGERHREGSARRASWHDARGVRLRVRRNRREIQPFDASARGARPPHQLAQVRRRVHIGLELGHRQFPRHHQPVRWRDTMCSRERGSVVPPATRSTLIQAWTWRPARWAGLNRDRQRIELGWLPSSSEAPRLDRAAVERLAPAPDLDEQPCWKPPASADRTIARNMRFSGERRAKDPQPARLTGRRIARRRLGRRVVRTGAHDGRGGKERPQPRAREKRASQVSTVRTSPMWSEAEAAPLSSARKRGSRSSPRASRIESSALRMRRSAVA